MATFLTDITLVFTSVLAQFENVLNLFVESPVLTIIFAMFVMSATIGLVTKVSHSR